MKGREYVCNFITRKTGPCCRHRQRAQYRLGLRAAGAELAVTWLNDKAKSFVEPLAQQLAASIVLPLDVEHPSQLDAVFESISERWGRLDFVLHSIAFAPKSDLHGRVVDSSRDGFARAMDISCHSFARMARLAGRAPDDAWR